MTSKELVAFQFSYKDFAFEENFLKLSSLVKKTSKDSIICAPELCLSNFCYEDMQRAVDFSKEIEKELLELSKQRVLCLTMIEKDSRSFVNRAKIFSDGSLIYQRDKYELFKFGGEHKHFKKGRLEDVKIVEIDGIRFGVLICFELRFVDLWKRLRGADIVFAPSLWGQLRKKHLRIISNAFSLINQCFLITANSSNDDMAKNSSISTPFGEFYKDDRVNIISQVCDLNEIKKMRRYLDVGIEP